MKHNGRYLVLTGLVALFLIIRLAILFASIDKIHFEEELFRGNIARELIAGPILPLFDYQRSEYEGGSLVMGVLAVPFFLLFGQTVFSLKLVALFFSVAIFIAWYIFLDKFFNRGVAILTGLLWIFSPPVYTKWGLFTCGAYYELNLFTILAVYIFYQIFFIQERRWLFALLGAVCGFALFFSYMFSVMLAVILLSWFTFDKKFIFTRGFLLFAVFFLLGFSPWIYFNLTHHFEGLIVADRPVLSWFGFSSFSGYLLRLRDIITTQLADSAGFQALGFISRRIISNAYYLISACSFIGLLFINRKSLLKIASGVISRRRFAVNPGELSREAFLLLFPIVYFLILSLTGFEFRHKFSDPGMSYIYQYRFFLPAYPFLLALSAVFLQKMLMSRRLFFIPWVGLCAIAIMVLPSAVSDYNMIFKSNFGNKIFAYKAFKGYNYYDLGKVICRRFNDPQKIVGLIKGIKSRDDRRYCYAGMGWGFGKDNFGSDWRFYIRNVLPEIDSQYWPDAYQRLGLIMGHNNEVIRELSGLDKKYLPYFYRGIGIREAKELAHNRQGYTLLKDRIDAGYRNYFHEGMGIELYDMLIDDPEGFRYFSDSLDPDSRIAVYRGIAEGREYYQFSYAELGQGLKKIGYDIKTWNNIISKVDDAYKPYCYQRLGVEIGWRFIHGIKRYLAFLAQIDEKYRFSVYKGVGIGLGWRLGYSIDDCVWLISRMEAEFQPAAYAGLGLGIYKRYGGIR